MNKTKNNLETSPTQFEQIAEHFNPAFWYSHSLMQSFLQAHEMNANTDSGAGGKKVSIGSSTLPVQPHSTGDSAIVFYTFRFGGKPALNNTYYTILVPTLSPFLLLAEKK